MDWKECNDKKIVKKIQPDMNLVNSLINSSENKFESAQRLELDEVTAASVITLCYDSLRELLEALTTKKGYKVYNHECYCAFLDEIVQEKELSILFNRFRKIRNSISYYGKKLSAEDASEIKSELTNLIKNIKVLF